MLQTIEVQIDTNGFIHTVDPIKQLPAGRGLLTLLGNQGVRACKNIFLSVHNAVRKGCLFQWLELQQVSSIPFHCIEATIGINKKWAEKHCPPCIDQL